MKALITGGARSGKSRYAQALAESLAPRRIYLATAEPRDDEMHARISRHRADRGPSWHTIEEPVDVMRYLARPAGEVVLLDCITLWLSNLMMHRGVDVDLEADIAALAAAVAAAPGPVVVVTNEVGLGIVPDNALARRFRDWTGITAQRLGQICNRVVLVCAGIPVEVKAHMKSTMDEVAGRPASVPDDVASDGPDNVWDNLSSDGPGSLSSDIPGNLASDVPDNLSSDGPGSIPDHLSPEVSATPMTELLGGEIAGLAIAPPCPEARTAAQARLDALAKPPGSLGSLEGIALALAAIQRRVPPVAERSRIIVFAADHGVTAEGVSPYPAEVTASMVSAFAAGRAAVSVLARAAGAELEIVDVGVRALDHGRLAGHPDISVHTARVRGGSGNIAREPAMSQSELAACMRAGAAAAERAAAAGVQVLALGEMGIGNTTAAAAVVARLLGVPAAQVVGPGTGLDAAGVARKAAVVERALARRGAPAHQPLAVLADVGGLELAALAGCMLAAAHRRLAVVLDGFIVGAAALAAARHAPALRGYLIPATRSAEPGHAHVLAALDIDSLGKPVFQLDMRLGEASGAALALPVIRAAARLCSDMATLDEVLKHHV